jgi:hypothetical protein
MPLFAAFALLVAGAVPASAAIIHPTDDAPVFNNFPDDNFGDLDRILTWTAYMAGGRGRSYLKFALDAPAGYEIASAVLHLYQYDAGGFVPIVQLHHVADDSWSQDTVTWNNRPLPTPSISTMILSQDIGYTVGWKSFDLLASGEWDWQADVADGSLSLLLKSNENGDERHNFHSLEAQTEVDLHPYLEVSFVPEPSGLTLLGVWGVWMMGRRARAVAI